MSIYDDLLIEKTQGGIFEKMRKVDSSIISILTSKYPNIPVDYISFLEEIGSGQIGNNEYMIYNGLLKPDEVFASDSSQELIGILIFGDDLQGYNSGFLVDDEWKIIEIDSVDMSYEVTFDNFYDFIIDKVQEVKANK